MATKRRAGLGRGLGALIPQAPESDDRAIDVFFNGSAPSGRQGVSKKLDVEIENAQTDSPEQNLEPKKGTPSATSVTTESSEKPATTRKPRTKSSSSSSSSKTPAKSSATKATTTKSTTAKSAAAKSGTAKSGNAEEPTPAVTPVEPQPKKSNSTDSSQSVDESIIVDTTTGEILEQSYPQSSTALSTDSSTSESAGEPQLGPAGFGETEDLASTIIDEAESMLSDGSGNQGGSVEETSTDATADLDIEPADNLLPIPGAQLGNLDPYRIVANTRQPRSEFDQEALEELTHSVREFGVFQPIVVRPIPDGDPRRSEGEYELIMGERRLRATKASGRATIPAIIRHTDDEAMLRDALLENLHRADLNPLEEASAYQQLLDDFGCSQQELSDRIGRSRPRISNTIRLLKLPVDVQRKVAAGVLSAGHARAVLSVGEPAAMTQLADKIINENLTVREAEMAAATMSIRTDRPPTKPTQVGSDSLNAHLSTVGERLGDRLNTRVKVVLRKTKGQISIDFASVADLNRILEAIGEPNDY